MKLSGMMTSSDWTFVKANAGVFALIVAAIGWWETNWGKNPDSPGRDWLCGYDYYNGPGGMQNQYRGFPQQIIAVAKFLQNHFALPVNAHNLYMFSRNHWKAGNNQADRDAWAKGVWAVHAEIFNDYDGTGTPDLNLPKFGRKTKTPDFRDLLYKNYRTGTLPTRPTTFGHYSLIGADAWGMLGNDRYGDCVFAGADHETMYWTTEAKDPASFTAANTEADYFALTGGLDDGCEIRDALKYRQNTGVIDSKSNRHKIGAYVSLNDLAEIDEACFIFQGAELGIIVTQDMMDAFDEGEPWTTASGNVLGGHDVPYLGTDGTWLYVVTWGQIQKLSPALDIIQEAWAILSPDMLVNGATIDGINLASLQADLAAITTQPIPAPGPVPTPVPTPPAPTPPTPTPPKPGLTIVLTAGTCPLSVNGGSNIATINGVPVPIDSNAAVVPFLDPVTGRTFIPGRFVAEALGCTVTWDEATKQVTIFRPAGASDPAAMGEYIEVFAE